MKTIQSYSALVRKPNCFLLLNRGKAQKSVLEETLRERLVKAADEPPEASDFSKICNNYPDRLQELKKKPERPGIHKIILSYRTLVRSRLPFRSIELTC